MSAEAFPNPVRRRSPHHPASAFPRARLAGFIAGFGLFLFGLLPAFAGDPPRPEPDIPVSRASGKTPCTCRAAGRSFELGSEICLGNRLMRCAMAINVTSWEQTGQPCPQS